MPPDAIVVHLAPSGGATAERIATALGCPHACLAPGTVAEDLRALFLGKRPMVAVMAAGIVVRALAPVLGAKRAEPAVLAVSEDGASVVPLLGGHRGANTLAGRVAAATRGHAAITTAGDTRLGVALDAPPEPWALENPEDAKAAMAALLAGAPATLTGEAPWLAPLPLEARPGPASPAVLAVEGAPPLVYRRRDLVLGVGCARGCEPDHLIGLTRKTLAEEGLSAFAVAGVFSLDLKADEPAVHALAADLAVPARFFAASALEAVAERLPNPSETVFREVGCHGVAEGAALVGSGGDLVVQKRKGAMATVAVAAIPEPDAWTPPGGAGAA